MNKISRKTTKEICIGNIKIGGNNPIAIQSMTNTKTSDVNATLNQIHNLKQAGCDIIRVAVLNKNDAYALKEITSKANMPVVADIHFDYELALIAAENGVSKIRINPGNIGSIENIKKVVDICKEKNIPIRIGVNTGSIDKEIQEKYGNSANALVESAKKHIKILEDLDFTNIALSLKASSVEKTIEAYEIASSSFDYPLHLGVTEAGTYISGSIKSAIAFGVLLREGIGDTVRVSLSDDPVQEVKVAKEILSNLGYYNKPTLVSCPTCGRCEYNMFKIVNEIDAFLETINGTIKVAIMGCVVNGPGEARDADIGIAGGKNCAMLFKKGEIIRRLNENEIIPVLKEEILKLVNEK